MAALAAYVLSFFSSVRRVFDPLDRILPLPINEPDISNDEQEEFQAPEPSTSSVVITRTVAPPYGQRKGWKPTTPEDYGPSLTVYAFRIETLMDESTGDGGAYPECHVAQYPLEMGRKKVSQTNCSTLLK